MQPQPEPGNGEGRAVAVDDADGDAEATQAPRHESKLRGWALAKSSTARRHQRAIGMQARPNRSLQPNSQSLGRSTREMFGNGLPGVIPHIDPVRELRSRLHAARTSLPS